MEEMKKENKVNGTWQIHSLTKPPFLSVFFVYPKLLTPLAFWLFKYFSLLPFFLFPFLHLPPPESLLYSNWTREKERLPVCVLCTYKHKIYQIKKRFWWWDWFTRWWLTEGDRDERVHWRGSTRNDWTLIQRDSQHLPSIFPKETICKSLRPLLLLTQTKMNVNK